MKPQTKFLAAGLALVVCGLGWWVIDVKTERLRHFTLPIDTPAKLFEVIDVHEGDTITLSQDIPLPSHMPSGGTGGQVGEDKVWDGPVKKTSMKMIPAVHDPLFKVTEGEHLPAPPGAWDSVTTGSVMGLPNVIGEPENPIDDVIRVGPPKLPTHDPDFQVFGRKRQEPDISPVPEPTSMALVGTGLIVLAKFRRRKK